uniref:Uncharacterized protein n=1 Tax=Chromera velia CCMP2878 TaxID=1169474 RepID=A0A0G4HM09_9ALVE|eukprot:Cvel_28957.t1-p1 / transcript=Cvel_28957.t1 / gene=Cvel_28957 / organism=Chromera_velia_CCMP2878 / gene_product=hypothetical protein / transcript_product=hypothetical protein / location=Cvel_scaffold3886:3491-10980(-) / protein_length=343 / sequence_SO=supercontig / SO=protein_coding / is_pseudo=false
MAPIIDLLLYLVFPPVEGSLARDRERLGKRSFQFQAPRSLFTSAFPTATPKVRVLEAHRLGQRELASRDWGCQLLLRHYCRTVLINEEMCRFVKDAGSSFWLSLSPDLQKETVWATFESFVTLIIEIILVRVALSLSFKEKYFAYKELLADLKSRSLEPADFVVGVKFWSLLPEEIKALARTKPKKQVEGTGDPVSVKHSWKYIQEVIEKAMATLDQKHTRLEWVISVSSGNLRLCSSSDTSVKKREIEVSKYHKDGAYDNTSGSSGTSLQQLIVATDFSRDIQSMDPERVQMLTDFSRKWSKKMKGLVKGSGSGNIGRSNNRKNRQQREQQSHQGQQQSDDK